MQTYQRLLTALLAVTLIPFLMFFSVGMVAQESILENFQEVGGELLPGNIASARTMTELYHITHILEKYGKSRDKRDKKKVEESIANLDVHVATHTLFHEEAHDDQETKAINISLHRFSSFISEYLLLIDKGRPQKELLPVKLKINTALDSFVTTLNPIIDRELLESSKRLHHSKQENIRVFRFLVILGIFTIFLCIALVFYISRRFRSLDRENENFKNNLESLVTKRTKQLNEKNAALVSEISERKKIEAELRGSEKNLETVLNSSIPICITSIDFEIITANQSYVDIWPLSDNNKKCHESRPGALCHTEQCPLQQIRNGKKKVVIEGLKTDINGQQRDFIITAKPFYDNTGELIGIAESFQEITERIKAEAEKAELEKELRQAQKMEAIGTLAGGIAHDFNNILMAISGYAQLAIMKLGDDNKITNELSQVTGAAERAKNLVNQILTFSRQTEQTKRPIQISPIVKEALKLLRASIPSTIEFKQTINSHGNILADPTQIHQIIMNLATNAYHAMLETGGILAVSIDEVTIGAKGIISELELPPGKYICLEVSDTGCGMDEETKGKIFDPYFTTKEIGKGTGLGLAVVHGIVTGHNGFINVYSEPGQGTTFHAYLPMIEADAEKHEPQTTKEPVRGGNERIIFIDDEEVLVTLACEFLKTYGYKVTSFTNAVQAMQDFTKHPDQYDLVISDMSMPYMSGLQLTQEIKKLRPRIPIILCSGHSEITTKQKALTMGVNRYIQKPVEMENIAHAIRELLDTTI